MDNRKQDKYPTFQSVTGGATSTLSTADVYAGCLLFSVVIPSQYRAALQAVCEEAGGARPLACFAFKKIAVGIKKCALLLVNEQADTPPQETDHRKASKQAPSRLPHHIHLPLRARSVTVGAPPPPPALFPPAALLVCLWTIAEKLSLRAHKKNFERGCTSAHRVPTAAISLPCRSLLPVSIESADWSVMATPSFAVPHRPSGDTTYGGDACQFVGRGVGMYDDEFLDEADEELYRSTSMQPRFTAVTAMEQDCEYSSSGMEITPEFARSEVTALTCHRDTVTPTRLVRKFEFSSIAEDFPTNNTSVASARPSSTVNYRSCGIEVSAAAAQITNSHAGDTSITGRITPVMNPIQEDSHEEEDMTVLIRSNSIERDSDEDRKSPFENTILQPPKLYQYRPTKTEEDEMEILRWDIQGNTFKKYFALQQREPQWGTLDVRDNRLFFHPGKRREAIMIEKKFHDSTYREGIAEGDASWYKTRREQFAEVHREFIREETRYKQELMLTRLEKNSTFSKLPILANRFLLVRLLGKGGNGEVWNVIDFADNQRSCALKLSTSVKHAQQEHFTHSKLKHPHIVGVGDTAYLIEYRQQFYTAFTVDSVETDLQQLIEIYGYLNEGSAVKVLFQLLTSLSYLHNEMEIAHYDLKPSNILISKDECVKLTDFDLARDVNEPIASSSIGTLRYLPPECYRPNFGDCQGTAEKADIWMVGIVYCLMIWGKHPICNEKGSQQEAKESLARYNGQLTYVRPMSDLSRWIVQGCLHPDPRCRPTASQLLQALQTIQQS